MFNDLLNQTRDLKYQITVTVLLKKYKPNGGTEFTPVYFNSSTKTVINRRYKLDKSFQETLYRIDASINTGSDWIIESIESQYINISTYRPLVGRSYIDLPIELKHPRKGLINMKNNDQNYFLWCHVRHINPVKDHPRRILARLKYKIIFLLMCLVMKINWSFQFIFLIKHLKVQQIYCF